MGLSPLVGTPHGVQLREKDQGERGGMMRRTFQDFDSSDPDLLGAVVGPDMVCDSEQVDETAWDDIESELSCSAREAHSGFLSFPSPGSYSWPREPQTGDGRRESVGRHHPPEFRVGRGSLPARWPQRQAASSPLEVEMEMPSSERFARAVAGLSGSPSASQKTRSSSWGLPTWSRISSCRARSQRNAATVSAVVRSENRVARVACDRGFGHQGARQN
jgi:hypothetical protein